MKLLYHSYLIFFSFFLLVSVQSQENIIDPWADTIINVEPGQTSLGIPEDVLGSLENSPAFFSLGGGLIEVDMGFGEEIENGPGIDFTIHEAGDNEGVRVLGKNALDEDWVWIGENTNRNEFDLEDTGLGTARFLRIEDLGSTQDGADIEAVEAFYYPNDPWADEVVSLNLNPDFSTNAMDSLEAIGRTDEVFVSLPFSTLVVRFTDNTVIDSDGDDLFITEVGTGGESALISVSTDGKVWTEIGIADNASTTAFDLAEVGFTAPVVFVRIEGLNAGGSSPGFDVDSVFALPNSIGAPPPPDDTPDDSTIVTVLDPQITLIDLIELEGRPLYPKGFRPLSLENGDVILALSDITTPEAPFNQLVAYPRGAAAVPILQVEQSSEDKQILSMFFNSEQEISLLIGAADSAVRPDSKFYMVRLRTQFSASQINSFFLY